MTFAGKDASEEFNMIHPPDVIGKYAPDAIIGKVSTGKAKKSKPGKGGGLNAPLLDKGGDAIAQQHYWGEWRELAKTENPGVLIISPYQWCASVWHMAKNFMCEIFKTIFSVKNFQFTNDRTGLTRSAIFLILFMVIHSVGNLHIFGGPDDFNGYGYFYVRLYPTGFGLEANIVEEYLALCGLLHALVALKRIWGVKNSYNALKGKARLGITGVILLVFMVIHLQQFRFAETATFLVRPPPYFINFGGILRLQLFWTEDKAVEPVGVRDIYKLEFDLFKGSMFWTLFYGASVFFFFVHGFYGWQQLAKLPAFGIPKGHVGRVQIMGYAIIGFVAAIYFSLLIFCNLASMKPGAIPQVNGVMIHGPHQAEIVQDIRA